MDHILRLIDIVTVNKVTFSQTVFGGGYKGVDMTAEVLLEKIDSQRGTGIFTELYGTDEVGSARQRYRKLITEMIDKGSDSFPETAGTDGNIRVFSAPGRTELGGNHTDHNRGKVLAASIQLDNVAIVQARNDDTVFFRSTGHSDVKIKLTNSAGEPDLKPKKEERGEAEALVRGIAAEFMNRGYKTGGFSANANSMVLAGSGLSSSAALEVLLGRIYDCLYNDGKRSSLEIAQIGQISENVFFGKPCGLMDQVACATGGAVAIDFANVGKPEVKQINFDLDSVGYALCIVNTRGSHSDLTPDYAAIPSEMKEIAAFFGKSVLGEIQRDSVIDNACDLRKKISDRAFLRALHFFDENERVDAMAVALTEMDNAAGSDAKVRALGRYLELVNESGASSWELLQNVFSPRCPEAQGVSVAIALSRRFLHEQKIIGAARVHGGGFAGTIQVYVPKDAVNLYKRYMDAVFGSGSVTVLRIRPLGAVELFF